MSDLKPTKKVTYDNIKYGISVEYHPKEDKGGYYAGVKVHFYNKKGVLIGNAYKFVPYSELSWRGDYMNYFYGQKFWQLKRFFLISLFRFIDFLIRFTQKRMD
jgi:hypothetical protein